MSIILSFIVWLLLGSITAYMANRRGRDPFLWFAIGMLLGLFGLILLMILPNHEEKKSEKSDPVAVLEELPPHNSTDDPLTKEWFYLNPLRQQKGPINFTDLRNVWKEGKIDLQSFVWTEGMENWEKITELPYLVKILDK